MSLPLFAWLALWRDWRAGELRIMALALVVAVAAVTAVGFFTDRIRVGMEQQAGELLAADLVVESGRGIEEEWRLRAERSGFATAQTRELRTVVLSGERLQLAEVKAVGPGYPLRGALRVADRRFGAHRPVAGGPSAGRVWLDPRLAELLGVDVGGRVRLGELWLNVEAIIAYEPDRGGNLFNIAPRLLMNVDDLPATKLLGPGSLITYRLLLTGSPLELMRYRHWIEPRLRTGERLLGGRDARPELASALGRAERYLGLASLVSVLLAGVAAATAAHRHARRHRDAVAVMRCLGASSHTVVGSYVMQLIYLSLLAALVGCVLGYAAQLALGALVGDLFAQDLPSPSPLPLFHGVAVALVTTAGFALPPVLALREVPPLRVLRAELGETAVRGRSVYGSAGLALFGLMAWQAGDLQLTLYVALGAAATIGVLTVMAGALVAMLGSRSRGTGVSWRFGLLNIPRRARESRVQVVAMGLGIMVLLLLSLVRLDLLETWRDSLPVDAPNQFLINIQPDQVEPLGGFLAERSGRRPEFFPMVKGRLEAVNGRTVSAAGYESTRAKHLVEREFNLSWAEHLQADNRVVAGRWWGEGARGQVEWSVEAGLAETLGIALGDSLRFQVNGQPVIGTVTSLRSVEWDSFRVNFFVVTEPGVLEEAPTSYVSSLFLAERDRGVLAEMVRRFPNVTVIDVDAIMTRVRAIMDRVSLAVEFVFGFTLLSGLVVLIAAIQASHDERLREAALLRTLGASREAVREAVLAEFIVLGLLAGALAALAASLLGYLVAEYAFGIPYHTNPLVWLAGLTAGVGGVTLVGWWGTRDVLNVPPVETLRAEM